MSWVVREDGAYLVLSTGQEVYVDGVVPLVNADGSLTIRVPASLVNVVAPIDSTRTFDMTDMTRLVVAVVRGGLTIAQISAVRPAVASAVQTFMTNHGLSPGSAP